MTDRQSRPPPKVWWSTIAIVSSFHLGALLGVYWLPPARVARATLYLSFILWQSNVFGVTIGYHRFYSHRSFKASFPVRLAFIVMASSAFQGSALWWCLRHRLHHRYTDDPVNDPYAATRGLFYSHIGWLFFDPQYEHIDAVDREDLDEDMLVRFQKKYYFPIAFALGFGAPPVLGYCWGDALGAFVYGGLVAKMAGWHCIFLVNSVAHWNGLQPYSDENTSKSNLLLAMLTGGEGNHNFHAFPHDYRSGPSPLDWDPAKWIIHALHRLGLGVTALRRARPEDVDEAQHYMQLKAALGRGVGQDATDHDHDDRDEEQPWGGEEWTVEETRARLASNPLRTLVVLDGFVVDVTGYLVEHPGGAKIVRRYAVRSEEERDHDGSSWRDASWAFGGGLNNHGRVAKRRARELRVAKLKV